MSDITVEKLKELGFENDNQGEATMILDVCLSPVISNSKSVFICVDIDKIYDSGIYVFIKSVDNNDGNFAKVPTPVKSMSGLKMLVGAFTKELTNENN